MARTRKTGVHDADADAASAPVAPPAADEDDDDILPDGEEEEEGRDGGLDNIDALIRKDMIAMYVRILGFKEGAATTLYDDQQITDLDSLRELDDPTTRSSAVRLARRATPS
jgi:hypothetical protein